MNRVRLKKTDEEIPAGESLHKKYRPRTWDEVIGQDAAVKSLSSLIERHESSAFLLSGPPGTGKTTLARIAAKTLGCDRGSIQEIPAALYTGVDAMRDIQSTLNYKPFGANPERALILDECHRLSSAAWDSLLKSVEEPPAHVTWFFCTTNPAKVPKTIQTRCSHIQLKAVTPKVLGKLFDYVCDEEQIDMPEDIGDIVIREAHNSPRQLLVNIAMCRDVTDIREAATILKTALDTDATLELCRFLAKGQGSWSKVMGIVKGLEQDNPEGVRIVIMNYMASALRGAKTDREAAFFLKIIDCFSVSYNQAEGFAPLYLSLGRALLSE